jgi:membrane protein YqaA with SNARE-associated domain
VDSALAGLFASAFISSTLLPGGSEALLVYLGTQGYSAAVLLVVATAGNTLGGMTSWLIGRSLVNRGSAEGLKVSQRRAMERMRRWGRPALLFSWLPVIGDPLCLAAGLLRIGWLPALVLIGIGKAARYGALLFFIEPT